MTITGIKQQEKLKGRYSIFVDGKYAFSLSDAALLGAKLTIGLELNGEELKRYKQLSADDKVYGNALRYAAMRLRSRWELESYLQRKQAAPALAEQILSKLSNVDMIDDMAFAKAWVESRRLLRPSSMRKLQQELRAKRVDNDIIRQVLQEDDTADTNDSSDTHDTYDQKALHELIANKRRQTKYQDDLKLMQYLARQGFSYGDIKQAMQAGDTDS